MSGTTTPAAVGCDNGKQLTLPTLLNPTLWDLPAWSGPNSNASQPQDNSETLKQLDMSLALLARYRNGLRPFTRITPDILVLIFQILAEEHDSPLDAQFGAYTWRGAAQVCHLWREVAVNTPILWTHITARWPVAALACVERSIDASLYLVIPEGTSTEKMSTVLDAVQPHIWRLRCLYLPINYLKTNDGNIHQLFQPLFASPAPMLETLETFKVRGDDSWIALPNLFTGHTPNLSHLKVQFLCPELRSLSFGKLKHLAFCGRKHAPIAMTTSAFLDLLQACPLLEVLQAKKVTFSEAAEDEIRKVELPNLRLFDVGRDNASRIADILKRLVVTEKTAIFLRVWLDRYDDKKFHIGLPSVEELELDHHLRDIKKLVVNYISGYEAVELGIATSHVPFSYINGFLDSNTVSNLGDMDSIAGYVFQSLIREFDLDSLEEFSITELRNNTRWTSFTKKLWIDTFQRMPNLKSLYVTMDTCYNEGFSRAILAALSTRDERTGSFICPHLETLSVTGDKTWSSLQCFSMAEERAKAGHPLKRVSMSLPHYASFADPSETDLPLLRKYVEVVDLEGQDISLPGFPPS